MYDPTFELAISRARNHVKSYGMDVDAGRWQGIPTAGKPDLVTREVLGYHFQVPVNRDPKMIEATLLDKLTAEIQPNLPWADEHFAERVGGKPLNPDPSYVNWPWWTPGAEVTKTHKSAFTHTYSERFWPRHAGEMKDFEGRGSEYNFGIRYRYGDLNDLIELLYREPYTRQAYLPIFFPEDTGAVHGGRIPCTLGYQFLLRPAIKHDGEWGPHLHMWYYIRSCDLVRHFQDDIYLAVRLLLWIIEQLQEKELRGDKEQIWVDVNPGIFTMDIASLHYHKGDAHHVVA